MTEIFIVPDPPERLIQIYETDKLVNLLGIRAEKYDSPEFSQELSKLKEQFYLANKESGTGNKEFQVPRNIQNPNYNAVLSFLKSFRAKGDPADKLELFVKFVEFCHKFNKNIDNSHQPVKLTDKPDVRCIRTIDEYANYIYTKYI